jgi:hypothetical protein
MKDFMIPPWLGETSLSLGDFFLEDLLEKKI